MAELAEREADDCSGAAQQHVGKSSLLSEIFSFNMTIAGHIYLDWDDLNSNHSFGSAPH